MSIITSKFYIGADFGKVRDFTAFGIVERRETEMGRDPATFETLFDTKWHLRRIERAPLMTGYPQTVERLRQIVSTPPVAGNVVLVIDSTGVGEGIRDVIREARLGIRVVPVVIHGGDSIIKGDDGRIRLPQRSLVFNLHRMYQEGNLVMAGDLTWREVLRDELQNFEARISTSGRASYGAADDWRQGSHDDIVFAVALAAWEARPRPKGGFMAGSIF